MSISVAVGFHGFVCELRLFCGLHEYAALPRRMISASSFPALPSRGAV
jgi:hypothetical protein